MKRTGKERIRQINGLSNMKNSLPEYSHLGYPNHEAINAQIEVIKLNCSASFYDSMADYISGQAYEAECWLNGEINDDLFE